MDLDLVKEKLLVKKTLILLQKYYNNINLI